MSGYQFLQKIRKFEKDIDKIGLSMAYPKNGYNTSYNNQDIIVLIPKDEDSLPVYVRGVELFTGTIESAIEWLEGVKWAREYDYMIGLSHETDRSRKEQDTRNRNLLDKIKHEGSNKPLQ